MLSLLTLNVQFLLEPAPEKPQSPLAAAGSALVLSLPSQATRTAASMPLTAIDIWGRARFAPKSDFDCDRVVTGMFLVGFAAMGTCSRGPALSPTI